MEGSRSFLVSNLFNAHLCRVKSSRLYQPDFAGVYKSLCRKKVTNIFSTSNYLSFTCLNVSVARYLDVRLIMKILLVEDHQEIAGVIFDFFEIKNYQLDYARDGQQGFELASKNHYDVIILDVMLPFLDGFSVCEKLRKHGIDTPILMLTARDSNKDILDGFEHGADDYLVKPFDLNILAARVNALYQRNSGNVARKTLNFSTLSLDLGNRVLSRNECQFQLNQTLFTIMKTLMLRAPDIATREEILSQVWQDDMPEDDVLRHHIYQLRSQIDKPFKHAYIRTIPKVGYQLQLEEDLK